MSQPIRADRIESKKVEWLWRERIPKGMLAVIAGQPDKGKGLLAAHIAAEVSQRNVRVLYSAIEDSASHMTKPRLQAAGARLDRILVDRFVLPRELKRLREIIVSQKIGLVVLDPFSAHLRGVSKHSDSIRDVLTPITDLLESTGCSMIVIEHVNKRVAAGSSPLNAISGSGSGLAAAARAAYLFGLDPNDEDKRVMACAKLNVNEKPKAITFEVDTAEMEVVGQMPFLIYDDELMAFDPLDLVSTRKSHTGPGRPPDKRSAAAEWLTNYLVMAGNPVLSSKIIDDAKRYGMSVKTLRRAAEDMKVVKHPASGPKVTWDLPQEVKDLMNPKGFYVPDGKDEIDGEGELSEDDISKLLGGDDDGEG